MILHILALQIISIPYTDTLTQGPQIQSEYRTSLKSCFVVTFVVIVVVFVFAPVLLLMVACVVLYIA